MNVRNDIPLRSRITTAMVVLAWHVLYCPEDADASARALARMILDAADEHPRIR